MKKSKSRNAGEWPVLLFRQRRAWLAWLDKNHAWSRGVWLRFAKKTSGLKSLSYEDAVDGALRYGWIDGQGKSDDDDYWVQKYTPRAARSIWSKRNREKALALIRRGEMNPAGLAEVERAKRDGRWDAAYDSPRTMRVPRDFGAALRRNARAKAFFETLDSRNRYTILFRLHSAKKAQTRAARMQRFIEMLARGEKVHR